MLRLIFALMLLGNGAAYAATYTPPPNAPQVFVPSHGVTVGVWAAQTAIGHGIGIFEKSGDGPWSLCFNCLIEPEIPTLDGAVNAAGGVGPYIESKRVAINARLAQRYPQVAPESTGTMMEKVNGALGSYALRIVNGSPQLGK